MHAKFYLLLFFCLFLLPFAAHAQTGVTARGDSLDPEERANARLEQHQKEMMSRMRVKREKSLHEDHLARAREAAQIAALLKSQYEARQSLDRDGKKKLEQMEKIVKKLLNQAGGDDDAKNLNATSQFTDLPAVFTQLALQSNALQIEVENTPRLVISTSVIERAGKLLGVIRFIRSSFK